MNLASLLAQFTPGTTTGTLGLVIEARQDDAGYSMICDKAVETVWKKMQGNAQLNEACSRK